MSKAYPRVRETVARGERREKMLMLWIIGIIITGMLIYGFIEWFNTYSMRVGHYQFFTIEHLGAYFISYAMLLFSVSGLVKKTFEDPLNGWVILIIGAAVLFFTLLNNFKKTTFSLALKGSLAQVVLFIPISVAAAFILFAVFAFFAQTKPVYNINGKD
ncbi:MAG: hypothetical protein PHX13_10380 [Thiovulaceae bacterium]|nr:hypothetical protein [Sulfurimonadaceae bacterium]